MFSTLSKTEIIIFVTFNMSSANAFSFIWSKILSCGNGLMASGNLSGAIGEGNLEATAPKLN